MSAFQASLKVEERDDDYLLTGKCPKCDHPISKMIPKAATLGLTYRTSETTTLSTSTIMSCNCGRHNLPGIPGCGQFEAAVPLQF